MAAVGPDSLVAATAMPSMSAFGAGKHVSSGVVVSPSPEDIFRDVGFHCNGTGRIAWMCCPYIQHATRWPRCTER